MWSSKVWTQRSVFRVIFCLLIILLVDHATPVSAQTATATVKGTVLDPNKAAVPGAKLTLVNQNTNISRESQSSEEGLYLFGNIPPGRYRLVVEGQGFSKWSGTFIAEVGETVVVDPAMQLGSFETIIEVTDVVTPINTDNMAVGDVKDSIRIQQLPLNGRFVSSLFDLTAGVEGGAEPRVNGLKVGAAEMLLDGGSIVDYYSGGLGRAQPGLETIQEFRIETVGSSAQFSRPATISLVTKSGTNAFHGSVFETHRNNTAGLRARQRQDGNEAAKTDS